VLTPVLTDLWLHHVPYRSAGLWLGRQLVIARLPDGRLWVHSPIPWSPTLRAAVAALGEVRHVVGPNRFHDECLGEFQSEYPDAILHPAPGLAADRPDLRYAAEPLSDLAPTAWSGILDQHLVRGMPALNEIVFLHRPSRSLILADLAFNLGPPAPWLTALAMRANRAWGRFTPSRFCRGLMRDRAAVRSSLDLILTWDFDRIIVGHGRNIDTGGKAALRAAFDFL